MIWAGTNLSGYQTFCTNYYDHGYYFTWDAALTACPQGWRLPTIQECADLIGYTGAGYGKGVAEGTYTSTSWTTGTGSGTGFKVVTKAVNGVSAGEELIFPSAGYNTTNLGLEGFYWTSDEYNTNSSQNLYFSKSNFAGAVSSITKTWAVPVRCVR